MILGIQYLRGLAAIMVAAHHARFSIPGTEGYPSAGIAGVDIFFVISGYVMALTTSQVQPRNLLGSLNALLAFMKRRFLRIAPLYWIALCWTARRDLQRLDAGYLWKDLFFIPRVHLSNWGAAIMPKLNQGWTLNFEMLFYLIVGLSMLFRSGRHVFVAFSICLIAFAGELISPVQNLTAGTPSYAVATSFYFNDIILEFLFGMAIFKGETFISKIFARKRTCAFWALTSLALICFADGTMTMRSLSLGIPAALLVASAIQLFKNFKSPPLTLLGDASYAIYLFHEASYGAIKPILKYLDATNHSEAATACVFFAHILAAIASGIAAHLMIEKPLNYWVKRNFIGNR